MFKKSSDMPLPAPNDDGSPWENETIKWLKSNNRLSLEIFHLETRFRAKPTGFNSGEAIEHEIIATGALSSPHRQYIHIEVTFRDDMQKLGYITSTYIPDLNYRDEIKVNLPLLEVQLQDVNGEIQSALVNAMQQTVISGQKNIEIRLQTSVLEHELDSVIDPSFYCDVVELYIWSKIHSPQMNAWHLPIGELNLVGFNNGSRLRKSSKN